MKTASSVFAFVVTFCGLLQGNCQEPPPQERLIGLFSPRHEGSSQLHELNPETGDVVSQPTDLTITGGGFQLDRAVGMAYDSTSRRMFMVADTIPEQSGRVLLGVDPDTGACTVLGDTGEAFASLAFDARGLLWGVTGKDGNNSHSLFQIEVPSSRPLFRAPLPQGKNGEAIAYNQFDGNMYRFTEGLPAQEGESVCALSPNTPQLMRVETLPKNFGSPTMGFNRQPMSAVFMPDGNLMIMSANDENTDFELHTLRFPVFQPLTTVKLRDRYKGLAFLPPRPGQPGGP